MEGRFGSVTCEELKALVINKDSRNTKKQTESTFNVLHAYCNEKCIPFNADIISQSEFNKLLCKFYAEARRTDGVMYKKNSFYMQ